MYLHLGKNSETNGGLSGEKKPSVPLGGVLYQLSRPRLGLDALQDPNCELFSIYSTNI
jgi:hypothetical protein